VSKFAWRDYVCNILERTGLPLHVKRVKPCDSRESVLRKEGSSNLYRKCTVINANLKHSSKYCFQYHLNKVRS
jgi:hypothetical protein